ncbi:uncharacterized protein [Oscarella lobularis]|uniref:uncharacterized protein n=1 Tax=Oscarella lobularis TaxID=121494 RepID=UPI0033143EE5
MCLGPWTVSYGLAPLRDPYSSSCDLLTNLDMAALQSPEFSIVPEGESEEKRSVKSRQKRIVYSSLLLDPIKFGQTYIMTGIINTPTLTKHASFNKAMEFTYFFENYGVHQLVVSMLCVSNGYRVLPMREGFSHYRLINGGIARSFKSSLQAARGVADSWSTTSILALPAVS